MKRMPWGVPLLLCSAAQTLIAQDFLVPRNGYTVEGCFESNETHGKAYWENPGKSGLPQFASCAGTAANTGVLRTSWFRAPAVLRFYVAGAPSAPGIRLFLEDHDHARTLDLRSTANPAIWRERTWDLPKEWQGALVRVVAEDHSSEEFAGWIGITLPQAGRDSVARSIVRAAFRAVVLTFEAILFLIPGLAALVGFSRRRRLEAFQAIAITLVASAVAGYAVFFSYVASPALGQALSGAAPFAGLIFIAWHFRGAAKFLSRSVVREVALCFLVVTLTAIFCLASGFLYYSDDGPGEYAQARYLPYNLPPDNLLPEMFAERLYFSGSLTQSLQGVNHSSDRPPLQTSLVLLEFPYWFALTHLLSYQLLGVWLQCTWVAGMWVLLRASKVPASRMVFVFGFTMLSGFCIVHSFFVWPKLLSATYFLICLAYVPTFRAHGAEARDWSLLDATLAASAMALSLLSHPDCIFTFVPLLVFALAARPRPTWSVALAAAAMLIGLLLPWKLYQTFIDPTHDTLMKLHLAGSSDPNADFGSALRTSYSRLTVAQFAETKWQNVRTLFGDPLAIARATDARQRLNAYVIVSFFALFPALGVLNAGFVARLFARRDPVLRFSDRLMLLALSSACFWVLIMFQGGSTWLHQGSFGQMLLFFAALSLYLASASQGLAWLLLGLQGAIFAVVYLAGEPVIRSEPNTVWNVHLDPGMLMVVIAAAGALAWLGYRSLRTAASTERISTSPLKDLTSLPERS